MQTAATEKFQDSLKTYAGVICDPTYDEYIGYLTVDALVEGLKQAGPQPHRARLIDATLGITNYTGQGLWGGRSIGFDMAYRGQVRKGRQLLMAHPVLRHNFPPSPGPEDLTNRSPDPAGPQELSVACLNALPIS